MRGKNSNPHRLRAYAILIVVVGLVLGVVLVLSLGLNADRVPVYLVRVQLTIEIIEVDGSTVQVPIPGNIGHRDGVWASHTWDEYGTENLAPIHTHPNSSSGNLYDGFVYVEPTQARTFLLGEFFDIWGQTFTENCLFELCAPDQGTLLMEARPAGSSSSFQVNPSRDYPFRDVDEIIIIFVKEQA